VSIDLRKLWIVAARWGRTASAVALLGVALGCGTKASNAVKVSGIVTLDGMPLAGAKVTYYPSSGEAPPVGFTDSAGRFTLSTFDLKTLQSTDGALSGEYKVTVEMIPAAAGRNPAGGDGLKAGHMRRPNPKQERSSPLEPKLVPANYTDVSKTPLKQVVPPQGPVELKLTKSGN
jgi:hypothetical protein